MIGWARDVVPSQLESVHSEFAAVETRMGEIPKDDRSYGMIHYDMDNIRWVDGQVSGIFDFDDCQVNWFETDIVSAVVRLFDKSIDRFDPEIPGIQAFVKGYRSGRPSRTVPSIACGFSRGSEAA